MGASQLTGAGVEADGADSDIVVEVLRYKSGYNSGTISWIDLKLMQHLSLGML